MKVTFTCEKCGHEFFGCKVDEQHEWWKFDKSAVKPDCPACNPPKLTYGPLTEEMVAEFLWECIRSGFQTDWHGLNKRCAAALNCMLQAAAVLRLLKFLDPDEDITGSHINWRDWLIDLAKKP